MGHAHKDEEPVIAAAGLRKSFGRVRALDGLDMTVRRGEVHGFLGPNGSGKTTTIRAMLGQLRLDGGHLRVLGRHPWRDAVEVHRHLAYVPGDVTLWQGLTGGECIDLLGRLQGRADPRRRDALIDRFDLDPTRRTRGYSKGNRQKVALIAALAADVELLLLDEPTAGLDPLMEAEFQSCVREATDRGQTVLLSSHILGEVEALCDRVTILRRGRTVRTGTLGDLRAAAITAVEVITPQPIEEYRRLGRGPTGRGARRDRRRPRPAPRRRRHPDGRRRGAGRPPSVAPGGAPARPAVAVPGRVRRRHRTTSRQRSGRREAPPRRQPDRPAVAAGPGRRAGPDPAAHRTIRPALSGAGHPGCWSRPRRAASPRCTAASPSVRCTRARSVRRGCPWPSTAAATTWTASAASPPTRWDSSRSWCCRHWRFTWPSGIAGPRRTSVAPNWSPRRRWVGWHRSAPPPRSPLRLCSEADCSPGLVWSGPAWTSPGQVDMPSRSAVPAQLRRAGPARRTGRRPGADRLRAGARHPGGHLSGPGGHRRQRRRRGVADPDGLARRGAPVSVPWRLWPLLALGSADPARADRRTRSAGAPRPGRRAARGQGRTGRTPRPPWPDRWA